MKQDDTFYDREPWTLTIRFEAVTDDSALAPDEFAVVFRDREGKAPVVYEYPAAPEIEAVDGAFVFTNHFTRAGRFDVFVIGGEGTRAVGSVPMTIEATPDV